MTNPVYRGETHFYKQEECAVFLESVSSDTSLDVHFFSAFACRQLSNLGGDEVGQTLAATLLMLDDALDQVSEGDFGQAGRLVQYSGSPGRKRFLADLYPDGRFVLKMKGFGLFSSGAGFYAPISVLGLLSFLLQRHSQDEFARAALVVASKATGAEFLNGTINPATCTSVADVIAKGALRQAADSTA